MELFCEDQVGGVIGREIVLERREGDCSEHGLWVEKDGVDGQRTEPDHELGYSLLSDAIAPLRKFSSSKHHASVSEASSTNLTPHDPR